MIAVQTPFGAGTIGSVSVRTPSGDAVVARGAILTPTGSKDFYTSGGAGGLAVDVSPPFASGSSFTPAPVFVTTNTVTAAATGGTAPYTYAWTRISGASGFNALSASEAATRFRITLDADEGADAVFRVTATDARGRTGTFDVSASAYNYGSIGGLL